MLIERFELKEILTNQSPLELLFYSKLNKQYLINSEILYGKKAKIFSTSIKSLK